MPYFRVVLEKRISTVIGGHVDLEAADRGEAWTKGELLAEKLALGGTGRTDKVHWYGPVGDEITVEVSEVIEHQ